MTILQLNPSIPVYIESHDSCKGGKGIAHAIIDYGIESSLLWVCFLDASKECWPVDNKYIRAQNNITAGRKADMVSRMSGKNTTTIVSLDEFIRHLSE
jgi:hypothetical protein